jgi:hypothetical protein
MNTEWQVKLEEKTRRRRVQERIEKQQKFLLGMLVFGYFFFLIHDKQLHMINSMLQR